MYEYKITIREHHLDTFGHMNNATYLELYEEARWQLITENGYGLSEIKRLGQGPVILDCTVQFLKEILLRETITITVETIEHKMKISRIQQRMIKADGSVASKAEFTIGFFDTRERKLITATPAWLKAIGLNEGLV